MNLRFMGMALALGLISAAPVKGQIVYVADNGFESPDLGSGTGAYKLASDLPTLPWKFTGNAGIAANGSAFDVAGATTGQTSDLASSTSGQAGVLQGVSSISQSVYLSGGNYTLTFVAEGRGGVFFPEFSANRITAALVSSGGGITQVYDYTPEPTFFSPPTLTPLTTGFLAAGTYDLIFSGKTDADVTSFIDNIVLTNIDPLPVPEPSIVALLVLGFLALFEFRRFRRPVAILDNN